MYITEWMESIRSCFMDFAVGELMFEERVRLVDVALGRKKADVVLRGGSLINVLTGEIIESCDIAICGRRIASVGVTDVKIDRDSLIIDARGLYVIPGLIDGHIHIESSMLRPIEFCRVVLPFGTTSVVVDPHEIANVLGLRGVRYILDESEELPLNFFVQIPSCVPAAPGMETSGAEFDEKDIAVALQWSRVVGLAEVMNYPGVLSGDSKLLAEIRTTLEAGKIVEGHAPGLDLSKINAYISLGIKGDHESVSGEEAVTKLRLGMYLEIREGSSMKNLRTIVASLLGLDIDLRHCILVTDDKHADDLLDEGHMNHLLHRVIEEGVDPVRAVQMATINVAEHFHLEDTIGSVSPGRLADLVLVKNLETPNPSYVFSNGVLVARDGRLTCRLSPFQCPEVVRKSIHLRGTISQSDLKIPAVADSIRMDVLVIGVRDGQAYTDRLVENMPVENGLIASDVNRDLLKVAVIERHKATGNIGLGFVKGFGIQTGAISSSVGHDSHNITVVGTNDVDMSVAVSSIAKMDGGIVVVQDQKIVAFLALPIAGLMSDKDAWWVSERLKKTCEAAKSLGVTLSSPFMTMSFLPLAVIPHLRITDKGLVDVDQFKIVPLFT